MDNVAQSPITMALASFAFAKGTTSTLSTTGTNPYLIQSIFYSRTALTNQATPMTDYVTGNAFIPLPVPLTNTGLPGSIPNPCAGYACAFTLGFSSDGTLRAIQGPIVGLDANGNFISGSPSLSPSLGPVGPNPGTTAGIVADNDFCPCGAIVVKSGSTAVVSFTFGTTAWATTGYTTSIVNLASLPGRSLANLTYS